MKLPTILTILTAGLALLGGACSAEKTMIICHRGLHHSLPENSKEAMLAAWRAGFEWCECDVYLTTDGVAVLMHDAKLDRTTEAKGEIARRSWAELKDVRLKNPDGTLSDCRIPTLEETLAVMPPGCGMLVEIKPADHEALVRETLRVCAGRKVIIQSFDEPDVAHSHRLAPGVPVHFLIGKAEHVDAAIDGPWTHINFHQKLVDAPLVERMKARGKSTGVWTVNDPLEIRRLLDLGIRRVITDEPERVRAMAD
ncbi:MAG: hypothetical protein HRF43_09955 [Phycisphaerae bacterium]|jgi:glycerophosphoryl diester phosphodiesterase